MNSLNSTESLLTAKAATTPERVEMEQMRTAISRRPRAAGNCRGSRRVDR